MTSSLPYKSPCIRPPSSSPFLRANYALFPPSTVAIIITNGIYIFSSFSAKEGEENGAAAFESNRGGSLAFRNL